MLFSIRLNDQEECSMKWISVKDRLPKESLEDFILFTDGKVVLFGSYFDGNSYEDECLWKPAIGWIHKNADITHWMPLPEPPEEEKST
jgi:Protein of unknown function (DUF551)